LGPSLGGGRSIGLPKGFNVLVGKITSEAGHGGSGGIVTKSPP